MRHLLLLTCALAALTSCVTDESVSARWDSFIDDNNTCEVVADCGVVYPGCPLGCSTAVSTSSMAEADTLADQLVAQYEMGGRACAYDCIETPPLTCEANVCGFEPFEQ